MSRQYTGVCFSLTNVLSSTVIIVFAAHLLFTVKVQSINDYLGSALLQLLLLICHCDDDNDEMVMMMMV